MFSILEERTHRIQYLSVRLSIARVVIPAKYKKTHGFSLNWKRTFFLFKTGKTSETHLYLPHKIDTQMKTKLSENVIHLTNISSISMRIKQCEWSWRVFYIHSHYLIPFFSDQLHNINILSRMNFWNPHLSCWFIHIQVIRRRVWREKCEFRSHWRCCRPHFNE